MKLDASVGFLLNKAAGEMKYSLENLLRPYNLTPAQWSVLARLTEQDGQVISDIGKSLFFDKPTMSGVIKRLHDKGLITKERDAADQRMIKVYLTESARTLMLELPDLAISVNQKALKEFTSEEAEQLKVFLKRILMNMR
ncbi:MarR family winged helix-turn-helix transcriptional regulator [Photobacterium sp. TY1-4]|uniref:MarR family winged helix-turn-helix transcriptional regulator n=1 Tax=Photobacterium sp. TY1-4 TaxID=2899122 RepID=UPI0021C1F3B2|nr:MarR family transcriptional regulator [Photobacterium sp. TY1-4]UXI03686.1 MarR family transcriptional regulator [Photobacterium sp. TY1-4]